MFEFALPWVGLLLPLPLWWFWRSGDSRETQSGIWAPFTQRWRSLPSESSTQKPRLRLAHVMAALLWILLLIAAAQPQFVGEPLSQQRSGRDLMLDVDLSGSMEMTDLSLNGQQATRLDVLQKLMGDFIQRRVGDRLGLVLFGEQAYLQAPLTFDRATIAQYLQESAIGLAGARSTAIGDGMAMGLKHLQESKSPKKALILVTDGANNAGTITPEQALELAKKLGVTVYTIGVGADEMIVRDFVFGNRRVNPSADLDEAILQKIAKETGGRYFRARDEAQMRQIYQLIDQLEPVASDSEWRRPKKPLYYWPLSLALIISAFWALLTLPRESLPLSGWWQRFQAHRAGNGSAYAASSANTRVNRSGRVS